MQNVTLTLSDNVMRRAKQSAVALKRPVEEMLSTMLDAVLPEVDDVPAELQAELARMTWLNDAKLWELANQAMPEKHQERLQTLIELQSEQSLTKGEREKMDALRAEYGRITLLKARAFALLSLRGGRPLLADA